MKLSPQIISKITLFVFFLLGSSKVFAEGVSPVVSPWVRFDGPISKLLVSPKGRYFSYIDSKDQSLKILELKTKSIFTVSDHFFEKDSFFWAPYGYRLFYSETRNKNGSIKTQIKAFDCANKSNILIENFL